MSAYGTLKLITDCNKKEGKKMKKLRNVTMFLLSALLFAMPCQGFDNDQRNSGVGDDPPQPSINNDQWNRGY